MDYVALGPDGPRVSRVAFGCEPLGGADWGAVDASEIARAVRDALDRGVTLFDTADVYGLGQSEERLAAALGDDRSKVVVATKGGVQWRPAIDGGRASTERDIRPATIVRALEGSLRRLRLEQIALYQIHWPDGHTAVEDTVDALSRCVDAGKVRFLGCSNFTAAEVESALAIAPIVSVQLPLSLVDRRSLPTVEAMRHRGVGTLAYGCLAQGLLSGRYAAGARFGADDRRSRLPHFAADHSATIDGVRREAARLGRTMAQVALRWALDAGAAAVIVGVKTVAQLRENLDVFDWAPAGGASALGHPFPEQRTIDRRDGPDPDDRAPRRCDLAAVSRRLRRHALRMIARAGSSHIGSCFSMAELLAVLYWQTLRLDPAQPAWPDRDRFILSKGHAAAILYAALAERGFFPVEWLDTFYQNGSWLAGHASRDHVPGVEASTGSLGHGLPVAVGMALAAQRRGQAHRVVTLLSDGECDEGSVWEAAMLAAHHGLDHLTVVIDYNKIQSLGTVAEVLRLEPLADKWRAFGWAVREVDGHDVGDVSRALGGLPFVAGQPSCLVAHTIKGKGVKFMEHSLLWHYRAPAGAELEAALAELGGGAL